MTWPSVFFWFLIIVAFWSRGPFLLYLFGGLGAFGTLQMLPGESLGGANFLPQAVCASFLVLKILLSERQVARAVAALIGPAQLGLLLFFVLYGAVTAYVLPRLFHHAVSVIPLNVPSRVPVALEATTGNVTQPAYLMLSFGVALSFSIAGRRSEFRRQFLLAIFIGGIVLIATGAADIIASKTGLAYILEPFRNASYTLLVEDEVLGSKRVVGLMAEASVFGATCVGYAASLAFLRPCFQRHLRDWGVPIVVIGLLTVAALSTSSTAYLGMGVFSVAFGINWLRRSFTNNFIAKAGTIAEISFIVLSILTLLSIALLSDGLLDPVYALLDKMILQKSESNSYVERAMWTTSALKAFLETGGLGVGLGSARTSTWPASVLSNTGVVGAAIMASFLVVVYLQRTPRNHFLHEYQIALKFSLALCLMLLAISATVTDFGLSAASLIGLVVALASADANTSVPPTRRSQVDYPLQKWRDETWRSRTA